VVTQLYNPKTTDGITKELDGDGITILKTFTKDKTTGAIFIS